MMKLFLPCSIAAALTLAVPLTSAQAERDPFLSKEDAAADPAEPIPAPANRDPKTVEREILVSVEMIEVDRAEAIALLRQPQASTDATALRAKVEALKKTDQARTYADTTVMTRSGQRAKSEGIHERIYATEFESASMPAEIQGPVPSAENLQTSPTPASFAAREIGMAIEVDPVLGNTPGFIDLAIVPQHVVSLPDRIEGKDPASPKLAQFYTMKITTAVTALHKRPVLLGVTRPHNSENLVFTFLEARDLTAYETKKPLEYRGHEVEIKQIGILTEMIEIDQGDLAPLLREHLQSNASANELRTALDPLLANKKADHVSVSYCITRSGMRSKVEAIHEMTYGSESNPGNTPNRVTGPIDSSSPLKTPAYYSVFETRNVGSTLEVDPILGADEQTIDLNLAPEKIELVGMQDLGADLEQPVFSAIKVATAVTTLSGNHVLLGIVSPDSHQGASTRRVLVFARATALNLVEKKDP